MAISATSIQEAAARYANTILANLNASAANTVGIDVMWFRATPDKRSQDVIFQSYTLYGVEDCPLSFKAVYTDTGYDDAAITYNIMGLNFSIPMTLDIPLLIWKTATGDDGTIPQEKDVVFIPITRKLLQVASMTPVKAMGGQLTSYKVNLEIYKPMRSRIVGENLKDSIKNNTTNLDERFGEKIDESIRDIVDDNQISKYTSTSEDSQKEVVKTDNPETGKDEVRIIKSYDLTVDGHTVARNYYDLNSLNEVAVTYKRGDKFKREDGRCLSLWFMPKEYDCIVKERIMKDAELEKIGEEYFIKTQSSKPFEIGDNVVLKRGTINVPGIVYENEKIKINSEQTKELNKISPTWYKMSGFKIFYDSPINFLSGEDFSIKLLGRRNVSICYSGKEKLIRLDKEIKTDNWYGIIINLGKTFSVDVFSKEYGLERIENITSIENDTYDDVSFKNYWLPSSYVNITNIRLYNVNNTKIDKQIMDLISYNAKNDSHAIINDSADTYINRPYIGKQR